MRLKLLLCVLLLALSVNATTVVNGDSLSEAPIDSTKVTRKHYTVSSSHMLYQHINKQTM